MRVNNVDYWFTKNQQGDIVRVENEDGSKYVNYTYDAWGNVDIEYNVATSLLYIFYRNVFTYRGYVYDRETGLYYLNSRYYDPVVGRFLNADDTDYLGASGTTLGYNLYAYCENNVISYSDPYGYWVFGRGITYQLVMPVGGFVSVSYVWDTSGNCGVLISTGIGIGVFSLSISYNIIISWRNTIYDYVGYGMTIGGSYTIGPSIGLCIGGDITFDKRGPSGFSFSIGFGVALFKLEAHVYGTVTVLIPVKNHNYTRYYALKCLKRCIQLYLRKK